MGGVVGRKVVVYRLPSKSSHKRQHQDHGMANKTETGKRAIENWHRPLKKLLSSVLSPLFVVLLFVAEYKPTQMRRRRRRWATKAMMIIMMTATEQVQVKALAGWARHMGRDQGSGIKIKVWQAL